MSAMCMLLVPFPASLAAAAAAAAAASRPVMTLLTIMMMATLVLAGYRTEQQALLGLHHHLLLLHLLFYQGLRVRPWATGSRLGCGRRRRTVGLPLAMTDPADPLPGSCGRRRPPLLPLPRAVVVVVVAGLLEHVPRSAEREEEEEEDQDQDQEEAEAKQ